MASSACTSLTPAPRHAAGSPPKTASIVGQNRVGWASFRSSVSQRIDTAAVLAYHAMSAVLPQPGGPTTTVTGVVDTRWTSRRRPGRTTMPGGTAGTPKRIETTAVDETAVDVIARPLRLVVLFG